MYQSVGLFHSMFYLDRGMEGKFPGGVPETFFQGSQGLKLYFQGGQGKLSKGVIPVKTSLPGDHTQKIGFLRAIFGIATPLGISGPKVSKENCLAHSKPKCYNPCLGKTLELWIIPAAQAIFLSNA